VKPYQLIGVDVVVKLDKEFTRQVIEVDAILFLLAPSQEGTCVKDGY
jgi:hypothetical protein